MAARYTVRFVKKPGTETLKGIITIYRAHGWWKPSDTPVRLRRAIKGSHCFAVAEAAGSVIGIGRAISDGAGDAYIQDMAVQQGARGAGVGGAILKAILKRLKQDGVGWVGLIAQDNSEKFYGKAGFRPLRATPMLAPGAYV